VGWEVASHGSEVWRLSRTKGCAAGWTWSSKMWRERRAMRRSCRRWGCEAVWTGLSLGLFGLSGHLVFLVPSVDETQQAAILNHMRHPDRVGRRSWTRLVRLVAVAATVAATVAAAVAASAVGRSGRHVAARRNSEQVLKGVFKGGRRIGGSGPRLDQVAQVQGAVWRQP